MAARLPEIHKFQHVLKSLMTTNQKTFHDLAEHFSVSLSTAKRLLNSADLSFEKVIKICEWLGTDLYKVAQLTKSEEINWNYMSLEQEQFLADNHGHYKLWLMLGAGLTPSQIAARENVEELAVLRMLEELEERAFIKVSKTDSESVSLLQPTRSDFLFQGPLWKRYFRKIVEHFIQDFFAFNHDQEHHTVEYGQRKLSAKSFQKFCREIESLYKKYVAISEYEVATMNPKDLTSMTCLVLVHPKWTNYTDTISLKTQAK